MNQLNLFIELTRLKKPIGFMLLFWPCAWGLTLAYDFTKDYKLYFFYLLLFFLGSVFMRSAGCIINDIVDKEFDKKVFRRCHRGIWQIKLRLGKQRSLMNYPYSSFFFHCRLYSLIFHKV